MEKFTAPMIQRAIIRARPMTPTALILRVSNKLQKIQPAFMKLVNVINDVESPTLTLLEAFDETWFTLPFPIRWMILVAEKLPIKFIGDPVLRYVINKMLIPYFLVENEHAYKQIEARFAKEDSGVIRDIVGEEAHTEEDAERYMQAYLGMIRGFNGRISVKPSSLIVRRKNMPYTEMKTLLKQKFATLFEAAKESGCSITVDAEEYFRWCRVTEAAFLETIIEPRFRDMKNEVGIAIQTYRKDALWSANEILKYAKTRRAKTLVRIVKGAYWSAEYEIAEKFELDFPLYKEQEDTDWNFNKITALFMRNREHINVSIASHNAANIAFAINRAHGKYSGFAVEVLNGMGESIRKAMHKFGVPVLVYLPTVRNGGSIKEGMAYLIRRLDEVANRSDVMKNV